MANEPAAELERKAGTSGPPMDKIVVAIHGIGSQRRSDTIRSVARRFGDRSRPPLPVMPLGFFNIGKAAEVQVSRLDAPEGDPLQRIGFAEVFWADIPRQVVTQDDTLEETKAWGASLVSRAQAAYNENVGKSGRLGADDFKLAAGVIDEIVETVAVMENLLAVTEKMGIFKFDLAPLLRDYIGDVQIVTEFRYYRQKIVARFHSAMAQIVARFLETYPKGVPEIYLVAHSEGTVVSFLGLLEALSGRQVDDPDTGVAIPTDWIRFVRGFMTIGSPIDKHLVLWPKIWQDLQLRSQRAQDGSVVFGDASNRERLKLEHPIEWRNYYDFGDPIGFKLETAVRFLAKNECAAFDFDTDKDDIGFSRYWLPGKAHNDYWGDAQVFGHFIEDVVMRPAKLAQPQAAPARPSSSRFVGIVSTAIPYLLASVLHFGAVFLLFKAVTAYLEPNAPNLSLDKTGLQVGLLALLLLGITVASRLPRLVKTTGLRWHAVALVVFVACAIPGWLWLPQGLADFLAAPFAGLAAAVGAPPAKAGIAALLLAAAIVAATGWFMPRRPRWGRRTLLALGGLMVLAMILRPLLDSDSQASAWPVVLGGLAFTYLWWLGILLFDLAFIWHRYIRNAVAVRTLSEWNQGRDAWPDLTLRRKPASDVPAPR
jgi:hypothetical protein